MADKGKKLAEHWQKLSKRERIIVSFTLALAVSWLLYQFLYAGEVKSVNALRAAVVRTEKDYLDITAQIADLRAGRGSGAAAGWQLADRKNAILFLEDVSGEARRLGVNLISVHPSQEVDKDSYKEVAMNLDLKARYRELAEFFKRLEGLSRVVSVRKIRIESCPDSSSVCAAQVEAVTYMTK